MNEVRDEVQGILRDVLDEPGLELTPGLQATDVEGWDSLAHISLLYSIESHFGISFTDQEMGGMQDVDALVVLVRDKCGRA